MTELRSSDELEGTLLPPMMEMGIPIGRSRTDQSLYSTPSSSALPVNYFDYNRDSHSIEDDISLGPVMINFDEGTPDALAREISHKTRCGTDKGRIAASEEKDHIRAANRKVASYGFHEAQRIEVAKEIAKQRQREGLNVRFFRTASLRENKNRNMNQEVN